MQPKDYVLNEINNDIKKRKSRAKHCGWQTWDLIKVCLIFSVIVIGIITLTYCHPVHAQSHIDYYQQQGFTLADIETMEQQANAQWKAEHSDIPPNLTVEQTEYLQKQTALLQETLWHAKQK